MNSRWHACSFFLETKYSTIGSQVKSTFTIRALILLAPLGLFTACLPTTKTPEPTPVRVKPIINVPDLELTTVGGQPGKITVLGAAVIANDGKTELDPRLSLTQSAGKGKTTTPEIAENLRPYFSKTVSEKVLKELTVAEANKDYIAVGCNQLDQDLVDGLTQREYTFTPQKGTKEIVEGSATANTIILCGQLNHSSILATVYSADRLVLIDVDYRNESVYGDIVFKAKTLHLIGKNKVQTIGKPNPSFLFYPGDLFLVVEKSIEGDGNLELSSVGGEWMPTAEKQ
jgi:hypothetical protein